VWVLRKTYPRRLGMSLQGINPRDSPFTNIEKHSVDFNDAVNLFQNIRLTAVDNKRDYGETRKISIGKIGSNVCVVVYTERKDVIRIISARKANQRERRKYYEHIEGAKT